MFPLWFAILTCVYLLLVIITTGYYIIISTKRTELFTDDFLLRKKHEPFVSIIVPTFNEEKNIEKCLSSLKNLNYSRFEIIVSDGGSTDDTPFLAEQYTDKVLVESSVPEGWIGKNYGCHLAAERAQGELLLFTDADTRHTPNSLRIAVSNLLEKTVDLLTIFPYQKLSRWWESIIPLYYFLSLFVSGGIKKVNDAKNDDNFVAIGQYLLFTKKGYRQIGGYERIKGSIIDDYAFARLVKKELRSLYYLDCSKLVYTEMYPDSLSHCWSGLKKFLYAGVKITPARRIAVTIVMILWTLLAPLMIILTSLYSDSWGLLGTIVFSYALLLLEFNLYWQNKGSHRWLTYLFFPVQMMMFIVLMLTSLVESTVIKTTTWKGRKYSPDLSAGLDDFESPSPSNELFTAQSQYNQR
ncbi:MAG: glycosyltransferase [Candidatus Heimdallarchaeota archaeon]